MSESIVAGDRLHYLRPDGGQITASGVPLFPGHPLTVGVDVTPEFAAELIADNVCRHEQSPAPAPAEAPETREQIFEHFEPWRQHEHGHD